ncbi:hypothetical protein JL722_608 [Aureococcus anophagefferens]|nr:hypothetical protein JL722_608 [Aureococcus anophagefferens]
MERFPQLNRQLFKGLPSKVARSPKIGPGHGNHARDVKTYLASDVDALVARLAAPEPVDPRWREVEAGTRYTAKTAMERYPHLTEYSLKGLRSEIARRPKTGSQRAYDVKTYLASDVDALVARLAAPKAEPVDPRWPEVEAGTRYTKTTAMERHPQLSCHSFDELPFEIARRPKPCKGPRDVKTYLATDVDALAARLAPEPVDPRWREVEAGARYDRKTAMKRYPQLQWLHFANLPFEIATKPNIDDQGARDVKTYLASDVDALVARRAAPETVDQRWREVESGARYDARTAKKRYPQLHNKLLADLPFEIARRPKIGNRAAIDIKTFSAAIAP